MKKALISTILLLLSALAALAQTDIKVQAPNLVGLSEQFKISFVISGEQAPSEFSWNPGEDFQLVWGPQKGSTRSVSNINGKRSSEHTTSYTYVLLPKKTGHFTLPAASATISGKSISSEAPVIEVVADGKGSSSSSGGSGGSSSTESREIVSSDDIFLRFSFSKRNVIVGEPLTATLKLYQRVNVAGFENVRFPEFNGFWSQELQSPSNIEFQRESVGDLIYNSAVLRSWTLIPQQSGELKIDPAELICLVNVRVAGSSTGSIFDSFFQSDHQTIRKRLSTEPVSVRVSALPAGAPASFSGGVGKFSITSELTKDSLKTHDAASLVVTVSGKGNMSLLDAPKVAFPPDFEVYDLRTSEKQGAKVFEFPFIPRSHGDFTLEPVEFSYFDIDSRKYVTLSTPALKLAVARGETAPSGTGAGQLVQGTVQKDVRSLSEDIRFIKTALPALAPIGSFFVGSAAWWILLGALAIVALAIYLAMRKAAVMRADVAGTKNRAAHKLARKRLAAAKEYLGKGLSAAFYEELHRALLGYVGDKFNIAAAEQSKEYIAQRFVDEGIDEKSASDFVALIDECEFARYAPSSAGDSMSAQYDKALGLISTFEGNMRKVRTAGAAAAAVLALSLMLPATLGAQTSSVDSLWTAGSAAYAASDWQGAAESWQKIENEGLASWELYYNIANACYRQSDIAHAILYYERALRLSPSNADVSANLALARSRTLDRIEVVPEFFLRTWMRNISLALSSDLWAGIALVMFVLALAMALLFALGRRASARRSGFVAGLVALLLFALSAAMAFSQKAAFERADEAVVVRAVASVKSSPSADQGSKDLFVLHEGTKLRVLDSLGEWTNVALSDGRQGWMRASELEII